MSGRRLTPPQRYDLAGTIAALALAPGDPTVDIGTDEAWWATRTPDGPGTLRLRAAGGALLASGYGSGTPWSTGWRGRTRGCGCPPDPAAVAGLAYWALHRHGIERRRADTIAVAARNTGRLDAAPDPAEAARRLTALPGIGDWTAAEVVRVAFGDADAVSVGDFHLPNAVAFALTGQARGDDAGMLALLEPFRGHRGRVCRLLVAGGVRAPRRAPRRAARSFARF